MNQTAQARKLQALWLFLMVLVSVLPLTDCCAVPSNSIYDPQPYYSIRGIDKWYTREKESRINWHVTPYYQHTKTARNDCGKKVPAGNIYGRWNMFGVFFNDQRDASQVCLGSPSFAKLDAAKAAILELTDETKFPASTATENPTAFGGRNLTLEENFNTDKDDERLTYSEMRIDYERFGLRTQLSFDFAFGLGIGMRTGVADYKQKPECVIDPCLLSRTDCKVLLPGTVEGGDGQTPGDIDPSILHIFCNLLNKKSKECVAKDLNISLKEVRETKWEDSHIYAYWQSPFSIADHEGEKNCTIVPYFSVGVWLPTGEERDQDRAFSIPTGNDGFTLVTIEAALHFDFPEMIQTSVGGGVVLGTDRDFAQQRVPTSQFQVGIIPWKIGIRKKPGATWYVNASFKAENFLSTVSFYFDYLFTRHNQDTLELTQCEATQREAFSDGLKRLECESVWEDQRFFVGLDYRVKPFFAFGLGIQSHISGMQVYTGTNVLGSLSFKF